MFRLVPAHGGCSRLSFPAADLRGKSSSLMWFVQRCLPTDVCSVRVMFYKKNKWGWIELTKRCSLVMMMVMMTGTLPNWPLLSACMCVFVWLSVKWSSWGLFHTTRCINPCGALLPRCDLQQKDWMTLVLRNHITPPLTSFAFFGFFANLTFSCSFDRRIIGGSELEFVEQTAMLWLGNLYCVSVMLHSPER